MLWLALVVSATVLSALRLRGNFNIDHGGAFHVAFWRHQRFRHSALLKAARALEDVLPQYELRMANISRRCFACSVHLLL